MMAGDLSGRQRRDLGQRLALRRRTLRIPQTELAHELRITRHAVGRIENGKRLPSITLLLRWCRLLEVDAGDVLPVPDLLPLRPAITVTKDVKADIGGTDVAYAAGQVVNVTRTVAQVLVEADHARREAPKLQCCATV